DFADLQTGVAQVTKMHTADPRTSCAPAADPGSPGCAVVPRNEPGEAGSAGEIAALDLRFGQPGAPELEGAHHHIHHRTLAGRLAEPLLGLAAHPVPEQHRIHQGDEHHDVE